MDSFMRIYHDAWSSEFQVQKYFMCLSSQVSAAAEDFHCCWWIFM